MFNTSTHYKSDLIQNYVGVSLTSTMSNTFTSNIHDREYINELF